MSPEPPVTNATFPLRSTAIPQVLTSVNRQRRKHIPFGIGRYREYLSTECPRWVNRVILTVRRSLPVYPDKQTIPERGCASSDPRKKRGPAKRQPVGLGFWPQVSLYSA